MNRKYDKYLQSFLVITIVMGLVFCKIKYVEIVFTLCWLVLVVYNVRRNDVLGNALSLENCNSIRGGAAIEIMIGHIGLATGSIIQYPNRKAGLLFVGLFFMLSGYGLSYGVDNKINYLKGFLQKRILKIFVPLLIVIFSNCLICKTINSSMFFENARWYVWEIIVLYFFFWLVNKYIPQYGIMFMTIVSVVIILGSYLVGLDNPWYGSTLCFPLGMEYYKIVTEKNIMIKNKRRLLGVSFAILLVISVAGFYFEGQTFWGNVISRNMASILFCLIILLFLERYTIGNKFLNKISQISYEIYLIHPLVIYFFVNIYKIDNAYLLTMLTILDTLIVAFLCKLIWYKLDNM